MCVLPTLRNGAFFAGAAARLKSSLRHMSSSRNTNSAGPSCTSSLTCKQQRPTLYSKSKGCVLKYTACEILLGIVLLTLLWSSVSSTDRESRPHCKTFRASMSSSLKYGQYEDRLTPAFTSFSGWSCHNKHNFIVKCVYQQINGSINNILVKRILLINMMIA